MDLPNVLCALSRSLTEREIRFAVIGGLGLHAYGWRRATFDLDLLVEADSQAEVVALLEDLGYDTLHLSRGYSNHLHPETSRGRVDCVYVRGETSEGPALPVRPAGDGPRRGPQAVRPAGPAGEIP